MRWTPPRNPHYSSHLTSGAHCPAARGGFLRDGDLGGTDNGTLAGALPGLVCLGELHETADIVGAARDSELFVRPAAVDFRCEILGDKVRASGVIAEFLVQSADLSAREHRLLCRLDHVLDQLELVIRDFQSVDHFR